MRLSLEERLAACRRGSGPPFSRLCDLDLEDFFQGIELGAGKPRRPIMPEDKKDWLRRRREDGDTLASMAARGPSVPGATLRAHYLYNLLLYPILLLEEYL